MMDALPTPTHMAQATLIRLGIAHYVVTTNLDGIYRKAGLKGHTELCCLHGDVYIERCTACGYDFERNYHVRQDFLHVHDHKASTCERCGSKTPENFVGTPGKLEMKKSKWGGRMIGTGDKNCGTKDTHINFGEFLDTVDWNEAEMHCGKADLCIIAGTSMSLRHITHFPFMAKKVVLINLQPTPDDSAATLRIWAKCDPVFEGLMQRLKIPIDLMPVWKPQDAVSIDKIPPWVDSFYIEKAMGLEKFYKQYEKDLIGEMKAVDNEMKNLSLKNAPVSLIKTLPQKVIIGNTHEIIQVKGENSNTHKWMMYVKGENGDNLESCIDFVKFKLHPTFTPPTVKVQRAPFTVTRNGWGTFNITVFIYWKSQFNAPTLKHAHDLSFANPDTFTIVNVPQ